MNPARASNAATIRRDIGDLDSIRKRKSLTSIPAPPWHGELRPGYLRGGSPLKGRTRTDPVAGISRICFCCRKLRQMGHSSDIRRNRYNRRRTSIFAIRSGLNGAAREYWISPQVDLSASAVVVDLRTPAARRPRRRASWLTQTPLSVSSYSFSL